MAEHLAAEDLTRLTGLVAEIGPAPGNRARAATFPFLARATQDAAHAGLSWVPWPDAVRFARIATGYAAGEDETILPRNSSLRLAAALISARDGVIPVRRCIEVIAALPASLAIPVLTEAVAWLRLDEDTAGNLIDCYGEFGVGAAPIEQIRLVRAAFRAIGSQLGLGAIYACLLGSDLDSRLRAPVIAACGIDDPDGQPRSVMQPDIFGLKTGKADQLDLLEALPPPQQERLLEQLLDDGFLDRSRLKPYIHIDIWTESVTDLVPSMSRDQLRIVSEAIPAFDDMGDGPRSSLTAAIAVRWARLGDFGRFRSTLQQVSRTPDVTNGLLRSVLHLPTEHLADWYDLVDRLDPEFDAEHRAILWALARFRAAELDPMASWTILDRWLPAGDQSRRTKFDESWQVLIDLGGYAPVIITCGEPGTRAQVHELLAPDQFSGVTLLT